MRKIRLHSYLIFAHFSISYSLFLFHSENSFQNFLSLIMDLCYFFTFSSRILVGAERKRIYQKVFQIEEKLRGGTGMDLILIIGFSFESVGYCRQQDMS